MKDISVDVLKIDLKFLAAGEKNEKANIIIRHVIEMAKALNLDIVMEGVETEHQVEFLKETGCRIAQGFFYYRPMPLADYERELGFMRFKC